jgi:hypothetical protein
LDDHPFSQVFYTRIFPPFHLHFGIFRLQLNVIDNDTAETLNRTGDCGRSHRCSTTTSSSAVAASASSAATAVTSTTASTKDRQRQSGR